MVWMPGKRCPTTRCGKTAVPHRTSHWDEASTHLVEQLEPLHQHPGAKHVSHGTDSESSRKKQSSQSHRVSPCFPENLTLIRAFAEVFSNKSTVTFRRDVLLHRFHLHVLDSHREVHLDFSLLKGPRCQGGNQHFSVFRYSIGWDTATGTEAIQMGQKVQKDNVGKGNESTHIQMA